MDLSAASVSRASDNCKEWFDFNPPPVLAPLLLLLPMSLFFCALTLMYTPSTPDRDDSSSRNRIRCWVAREREFNETAVPEAVVEFRFVAGNARI
jgi:hypothetical protein